jgi:hypothetical protein
MLVVVGPRAEANGISFYGVYPPTMALLACGYLMASTGLWLTSKEILRAHSLRVVAYGLRVVSIGLVVLFLSPYNQGAVLDAVHISTGVIGAVVQLIISIVLLRLYASFRLVIGFLIQLGGGIMAAIAMPNWGFGYLLQGEVIYQVGFGWCLIAWTYQVARHVTSNTSDADVPL